MKSIYGNQYLSKWLFFSCLLLTGCMQSTSVVNANQPDWVNGEPLSYPNSQYVVATGSASNMERAKDRALANLSKVFELRIRESSTTRQDTHVAIKNGAESVDKSQRINQNINIQTNKIIDGARVAEQWQSRDLTFYALAVLDRHQAGNNIREEMSRLDKETDFELSSIESKSNPLQKIAAYQRVLASQDKRSALQKTLKVIDLSGQGDKSKWNRAELNAQLEASLSSLNMKPEILQDAVGGLDKLLKGAMSKSGFPESLNDSNSYVLASGLEIQSPVKNQNWYWLRGTLMLRLTSAEGKVLGNKTWPLKVSASSEGPLNQRLMASVEKVLNQELKATLLGFSSID
ncbi:MAG: LPP20 family lipoprotein [Gammaproteobacteria bacterium]|nr:LPP20 family lipoprotein [Gammaproteobacteria bacterium]